VLCNFKCLQCVYADCINEDSPMTLEERYFINDEEADLKSEMGEQIIPELGMKRYIHNRPDKHAYIKARNAEYEQKRKGRPDRVLQKKKQYLRHREAKIEYQKAYYSKYKDEILAKHKSLYEENKDEINAKRRERYKEKHPPKVKQTIEERRAKQKIYREKNREEINRKKREAYYRKKGEANADNKDQ
jgi:hypothetical protein